MAVTVTMPQLGETVTEGTVLSWAKAVGETIAEDEVLLEISTDKVDAEVPSPAAGVIQEILVPEGETVTVGTALVVISAPDEDTSMLEVPEAVATQELLSEAEATDKSGLAVDPAIVRSVALQPNPGQNVEPIAPATSPIEGADVARRGVFSPVVRRLAMEHGVDLGLVMGSGVGGRITRKDVMAVIEAGRADIDQVVESSRLRQRIAKNMLHARRSAAHVWASVEVDYEAVEQVRQARQKEFKEREGFSLTYLPFVARATMEALAAYPVVNSSFDLEGGTQTLHSSINLGIAVDLDQEGLVVVTIKDADGLRFRDLARDIRERAIRARAGGLELGDVGGSTFTITNPGPFGSYMTAPIINVPNVGILSTDTVAKRPTVIALPDGSDAIAIRHIGYLGLSWDHRAFDGVTAMLFMNRIKENLQSWDWDGDLL